MTRAAPLIVTLLCGLARAEVPRTEPACAATYERAFSGLHEAAGALRLKANEAQAEVARLFGERPTRCEGGAYAVFLSELMRFARRALRSGATPQTPKEGWIRGAAAAMAYAPREVPRAEYYDDIERFREAKSELLTLIAEAGAGPVPSLLLPAFIDSMPQPSGDGGPPVLLLPQGPIPELEPAPAPLSGAAQPRAAVAVAPGLADTYAGRGGALYKDGRFLEAAEELRKAYLIQPRPQYLFNIAQAYRRGGRPKEALALYREFLLKDPQSQLRYEAKGHIDNLEVIIREQAQAEQMKQALRTEQSRVQSVEKDLQAARARAERAEREKKKPVYRRGWFWGVLSTGVAAAVGVGLGVGLAPRDPTTDGGIINLSF